MVRREQTVDDSAGRADRTSVALNADDPFAPPSEPTTAALRAAPARRVAKRKPRATGHPVRDVFMGIRMLPSERARVNAAAAASGLRDASRWARTSLLAACEREPLPMASEAALAEVARLRRDLNSGVGSNLNQALAHANALAKGGQSADGEALRTAVAEAREALTAVLGELRRVLRPAGR